MLRIALWDYSCNHQHPARIHQPTYTVIGRMSRVVMFLNATSQQNCSGSRRCRLAPVIIPELTGDNAIALHFPSKGWYITLQQRSPDSQARRDSPGRCSCPAGQIACVWQVASYDSSDSGLAYGRDIHVAYLSRMGYCYGRILPVAVIASCLAISSSQSRAVVSSATEC